MMPSMPSHRTLGRVRAGGAKGAPSRFADECRPAAAIQRSPARTRPRVLCEGMEGIISNRADAPYSPGKIGLWLKAKCKNREEFVVVGWTDPEGARPLIGALLLAYYDSDRRLVYAGRVGTGIDHVELERLLRGLQPLATSA